MVVWQLRVCVWQRAYCEGVCMFVYVCDCKWVTVQRYLRDVVLE